MDIHTGKGLAQNSLSQSKGGGTWWECVRVEEQAVGGNEPQVEACSKYVREKKTRVGARKGSRGKVVI